MLRTLNLLYTILFLSLFKITVSSNSSFEIDPKEAQEWLERSKKNFKPKDWANSVDIDSLPRFLEIVEKNEEVYTLFYNINDNSTFSTSPFFKTTAMAMHDENQAFPIVTVNMTKATEIAQFYGLRGTHTIVLYFYKRAPIVFKYHDVQTSPRPLKKWMTEIKQKVANVKRVKSEDDLGAFENSDNLMFLAVDEGFEHLGEMFASLSANYPDLEFSWMVRDDSTRSLEQNICEQYNLNCQFSGGKQYNTCINF